ncbi:unnamed protein product [Musa banksii]
MIVDVGEEKEPKLAGSETLTRSSSSDRVSGMPHEKNSPPPEHEEEEESQQTQPLRQQGFPPHKVARVSSDEVTMAAPSSLMLGLGLGLGRGPGAAKPVFTFMQLQELEHQALIYKYMAAGLPVPVHLVLPIWKSVAASSFGAYVYPSLTGYGSLCLDYRNSMEPEPGRCRRTDGKKWRCSRDVVPDQKYCERHMHRGRNRSRKPVEAGAAGGGDTTSTVVPTAQHDSNSSSTQLSILIPANGRQLLPTMAGGGGGGGPVSQPELGILHNGTACKTATP